MKIFKDIECVYSCMDENNELQGGKYNCVIVSDKGSISFIVTEIGVNSC
jgi:hypothetical protein